MAAGTRVVLPAPGGACRTTAPRCESASRTSGRTTSIGSAAFIGKTRSLPATDAARKSDEPAGVLNQSRGIALLDA